LAAYLGVSTRTIQRWIKEQAKPGQEQLQKIAQYIKENTQ
jgi:DNA-binding transcriptional regulator YiaG